MKNINEYHRFLSSKFASSTIAALHTRTGVKVSVRSYFQEKKGDSPSDMSLDEVESLIGKSNDPRSIFISKILSDKLVSIIEYEFDYEDFGNYELKVTLLNDEPVVINELLLLLVKNRSADQYGFKKQVSIVMDVLLRKYKKLENRRFSISTTELGLDKPFVDLINVLNKLCDTGYVELGIRDINIIDDEPAYDCVCIVTLRQLIIHHWRIENGYTIGKISFDTKTGQLWMGDRNYQMTRPVDVANDAKIAKFIELLVKKVNTITSYKELSEYVSSDELYEPGSKDKIRRYLVGLKKDFEEKILKSELENTLIIQTIGGGFRLIFSADGDLPLHSPPKSN